MIRRATVAGGTGANSQESHMKNELIVISASSAVAFGAAVLIGYLVGVMI
jgi:hypothetical protein